MTIKIAFYKAKYGDWRDKTISMVTNSPYSHCEIVLPDGNCASSSPRDGGVRIKNIDLGYKWDVFNINQKMDEHLIRYWFNLHYGEPYNWIGAIASPFGLDIGNQDKKFCSYCCATVLGIQNPIITPGGLYMELVESGII